MKHRGIVMSKKGMVASAHTLISASGLKVLNNGGNAMDACIAMALTSGVILPDMCGLGGDAFMLYYDAKTKKSQQSMDQEERQRKRQLNIINL